MPRLDAYLANPEARRYDGGDPGKALHHIAERLCAEGSTADMEQIGAYFAKHRSVHPGEDYALTFDVGSECKRAARAQPLGLGRRGF